MAEAAPIRTAIIGYGYVGRTFHAPLIRATPGLALTVIGSSRPATEIHETTPETRVVSDPLAVVTDPDVDLVVIASPNDSHARLAEAALGAGKHVVVDKPFTVSLAEARRVAQAAERAGLLLSVFQNRRWDSDFLTVQAALAAGRLGTLVQYESRIDRYRPLVQDRWRERPAPGGGLWFDLGSHLVDQALLLFGLPQSVTLHTASQRRADTAPDWFLAVLTYPHLHAILSAGVLVSGGSARFRAAWNGGQPGEDGRRCAGGATAPGHRARRPRLGDRPRRCNALRWRDGGDRGAIRRRWRLPAVLRGVCGTRSWVRGRTPYLRRRRSP